MPGENSDYRVMSKVIGEWLDDLPFDTAYTYVMGLTAMLQDRLRRIELALKGVEPPE